MIIIIAAMTYNQVQPSRFQINNCKSLRAWTLKLLDIQSAVLQKYCRQGCSYTYTYNWLGTTGPVDCYNRVFEEYIDFFNFIGWIQTIV